MCNCGAQWLFIQNWQAWRIARDTKGSRGNKPRRLCQELLKDDRKVRLLQKKRRESATLRFVLPQWGWEEHCFNHTVGCFLLLWRIPIKNDVFLGCGLIAVLLLAEKKCVWCLYVADLIERNGNIHSSSSVHYKKHNISSKLKRDGLHKILLLFVSCRGLVWNLWKLDVHAEWKLAILGTVSLRASPKKDHSVLTRWTLAKCSLAEYFVPSVLHVDVILFLKWRTNLKGRFQGR